MPVGAAIAAAGVGGAAISAVGANKAANTQADAANNAAQLQLGMFNTIRNDLAPYRNVGTAALPGYNALLGLPAPAAQPAGQGAGAIDPTAFTGGGLIGSAMPAVGSPNWDAYLQANPDVFAEYQRASATGDPNSPAYAQHGLNSPQAFAQYHYQTYGQGEGRQLPSYTQADLDALYPGAGGAGGGAAAGGGGTSAAPVFDASTIQKFLENTPGYQFTKQQGTQAVENSLAARGLGGLSGSLGKGLARFVTGLADQTYQQQLQNYAGAVGVGQSAANQTGAYGQAATQGAAGSLQGAANASAAGTLGAANAISGGLNSAAGGYLTSRVLGMYGPQAAAAPSFAYGT